MKSHFLHKMRTIHIYCSNISAHIGIMGVIQNAVADALKYGNEEIDVIGGDYSKYYRFEWDTSEEQIVTTNVDEIGKPDMVLFMPWGKYRQILPLMLRSKLAGAKVGIWAFGFFAWQQNICNWQGGKTPIFLKKILTKVIKMATKPIVNFYLMAGNEEIKSSRLPAEKCVKITFGVPQSKLLDAARKCQLQVTASDKKNIIYFGRGQWIEKGVSNIVNYSKSNLGSDFNYEFFFSKRDEQCDSIKEGENDTNLQRIENVNGAELLPYIKRSVALFTLNQNPIQLRSLYETLSAGCKVVVMKEAFMDEIKKLLEKHGAGESVMIVDAEQVEDLSYEVKASSDESVQKTIEVMQVLLDRENFGKWFASWLSKPNQNQDYYHYTHNAIIGSSNKNML